MAGLQHGYKPMKLLKVLLSGLVLVAPLWFAAPASAQEAQVTQNADGTYTVTLADGSQQAISADLAAQIQAAVNGETGVDVASAISDLVSANPDLTLAIVAFGTAQRPAAANAIAFGAIEANPDAGDDIVAAAQSAGGNISQTVISFAKTGAGAQGVRGRARILAIADEDGDDGTVDTAENPSTDTQSPTTI